MAGKKRLSELSERLSEPSERLGGHSERLSEVGASVTESGLNLPGADTVLVCASGDLADGGDGIRFDFERDDKIVPAFAIRHGGRVYAYLNRCAHIAMELDWKPGKFFDAEGEYLICSTHGALYAPESGACRGGPCRGAALSRLNVLEAGGKVYIRKG
ncbi:MAG: Rieske 2Fe-2S domain-containing protein [Burkholderiales bacterium]|nr:Rieske 2Fe-2S domain-containing protein [Burkholderiales bacterium]